MLAFCVPAIPSTILYTYIESILLPLRKDWNVITIFFLAKNNDMMLELVCITNDANSIVFFRIQQDTTKQPSNQAMAWDLHMI